MIQESLFPDDLFEDIERLDGIIALVYSFVILILSTVILYIIKNSQLYSLILNEERNIYDIIFVFIMDFPQLVIIYVILKIRKQKFHTIGLRKKGLWSSLIVGGILFIIFINSYLSSNNLNSNLFYNIIFYVFFIGFNEELVFRGFIWPRLVKSYGKLLGTILSGMFFGAAHLPLDIVWNNVSVFDAVVLGKAGGVNILGGVVFSLIYCYIYTRNNNILLPSFIHGILDLSSIL